MVYSINFFEKPFLFLSILLLNLLGALLEGVSYGFVILAFNSLTLQPLSFFIFDAHEHSFLFYCVGGILSQCIKSGLCLIASIMNARLTMYFQKKYQMKIYQQILSLSFGCVQSYKIGELITFIQSPITFFPVFFESFNQMVVAISLSIASLTIMISISPFLTIFAAASFSIVFYLQKKAIKRIQKNSSQIAKKVEDLNIVTLQNLSGLRIIHLFNHQKHLIEKMGAILTSLASFSKKIIKYAAASLCIQEIVGTVVVTSCMISGYYVLPQESAKLPLLLTFMTIAYRLSGKVSSFSTSLQRIASLKGSWEEMQKILKKEDKEFQKIREGSIAHFSSEILLQDIEFKYTKNSEAILSKINVSFPKGKVTAIVGTSGAGKSTLLDLIGALYEPTRGKILVDGKDLSQINLAAWREHVAFVHQDTFIFNDTIEENIRLGKIDADAKEIEKAAEYAFADPFIKKLPEGYKTIVGERGHRLSGGERQRIALARALIRKASILILDEATSHLDSQTEFFIQQSLNAFKEEKTLIVVAHRLATIKNADYILVLERGKVIEKGTHDELVALNAQYARFWRAQRKEEIHESFSCHSHRN